MRPEDLRKIAALLREEDALIKKERTQKMAHVIQAAAGLAILKRKLGVR